MRTTRDVAAELPPAAWSLAAVCFTGIEAVLGERARQALWARAGTGSDVGVGVGGFPVFVGGRLHRPITSEAVANALHDV